MRKGLKAAMWGLCLLAMGCGGTVYGQLPEPGSQPATPNPLVDATVKPGKMLLYDLEARFAKDVAERGARRSLTGLPRTVWRWATGRRRWWVELPLPNRQTGRLRIIS